MNNKRLSSLSLELFEDKRPNILTNDSPSALLAFRRCVPGKGQRPNTYISYHKSQLSDAHPSLLALHGPPPGPSPGPDR